MRPRAIFTVESNEIGLETKNFAKDALKEVKKRLKESVLQTKLNPQSFYGCFYAVSLFLSLSLLSFDECT